MNTRDVNKSAIFKHKTKSAICKFDTDNRWSLHLRFVVKGKN